MDNRNLSFDEIKEFYSNGESGFNWGGTGSAIDLNGFRLEKNGHSILVTEKEKDKIQILYSVGKSSTYIPNRTVSVSELEPAIKEWSDEHESKPE